MSVHYFPFTIALADTDAQGVVYHARYLDIAERARMNWLCGKLKVDGDIGFVVSELNIKYLQPLKVSDEIIVETIMTNVGMASVRVEQKFVKDGIISAIINLKVAYLGADMRPKKIPQGLLVGLI